MTVSVTQSLSEFTCVYSEIHANFGTHVYIFCYKIVYTTVVPYAVILKENVRVNTRCLIPGKHYKPNANRITKLVVEAHTCYRFNVLFQGTLTS